MPATVLQLISLLPIIHLLFTSLTSSVSSTAATNQHQPLHSPPPSPPLYNAEELWELCQSFPAMERCDVFASGDGGAAMVSNANGMVEKRKSAYMRFGRSDPSSSLYYGADGPLEQVEKRKSAYMRFGKRSSPQMMTIGDADAGGMMALAGDAEKRKSAYMRFGKRKSAYMRFGKRSAAAPSSDDDMAVAAAMEKRKSAYMRFGK